ncbi:hypothetical protein SO694_00027397 [Aureococcus anophagefferens]|uniref:CSC1/OSCA1-like cytosolic domain-containing protein n=1 Tax=Aureococcus anophagefferens TaxID=44056 RepID=A0ABR1FUV1_AURAN
MEQRAAALEQAIEKDLAAVEAKTKEGLAKAAGAAKLTEDEIVEELEDLQQGVRETIETDDFDMGKTLGATTYFYMDFLKALMVVCFVAGCASVPSIRGYRRGRYSTRTRRDRQRFTFPSMSPFCMDYETVTATAGCAHGRAACDARYAPRCALTRRIAAVDAAATGVAVVLLAIFVATVAGKARKIDEAVQTPQDYSVMVTDPDADADDADEWRQFFARFGAVRAVTITRNNARLVGELAGLWRLLACQGAARRARAAALERHVALARRRVRALCGLRYDVSCVFVTFERERDQVACLNALTVGSYSARTDTTGDPRVRKFRGHNVLRVKEAPEPPDVGWRELGSVGGARSTLQKFATVATVAAALVAVSSTIILVATVRRFLMLPSWGDGVIVAVVNAILPQFFKVWSKTFEVHRTESSRQRSLLRQLYAARLLNGIVAVLVTPRWTHMLRRDTLNRLRDILLADVVTSPLARVLVAEVFFRWDLSQAQSRWGLAVATRLRTWKDGPLGDWVPRTVIDDGAAYDVLPRSFSTLDASRKLLDGDLAERLADAVKVVINATMYSLLFPGGWFLGLGALALNYVVDKYLLLRRLRPPRARDPHIVSAAAQDLLCLVPLMKFGVSLALAVCWPFDEAVAMKGGGFRVVDKGLPFGEIHDLVDVLKLAANSARLRPRNWMPKDQVIAVRLYRWAIVASFLPLVLRGVYLLYKQHVALLRGDTKPEDRGRAQDIPFTEARDASLQCYVPVVHADGFVLCECANVKSVPFDHLPKFGLPHSTRIAKLLDRTKEQEAARQRELRRKKSRKKPRLARNVAAAYDLSRLLCTCLDRDRAATARKSLSLIEYFEPPPPRTCAPRCLAVVQDDRVAASREAVHEALLADVGDALGRDATGAAIKDDADVERAAFRVAEGRAFRPRKPKRKKRKSGARTLPDWSLAAAEASDREDALFLDFERFVGAVHDCGACACGALQRNRLGRLFNALARERDDLVTAARFAKRVVAAYKARHAPKGPPPGRKPPAKLYEARDLPRLVLPPEFPTSTRRRTTRRATPRATSATPRGGGGGAATGATGTRPTRARARVRARARPAERPAEKAVALAAGDDAWLACLDRENRPDRLNGAAAIRDRASDGGSCLSSVASSRPSEYRWKDGEVEDDDSDDDESSRGTRFARAPPPRRGFTPAGTPLRRWR